MGDWRERLSEYYFEHGMALLRYSRAALTVHLKKPRTNRNNTEAKRY